MIIKLKCVPFNPRVVQKISQIRQSPMKIPLSAYITKVTRSKSLVQSSKLMNSIDAMQQ